VVAVEAAEQPNSVPVISARSKLLLAVQGATEPPPLTVEHPEQEAPPCDLPAPLCPLQLAVEAEECEILTTPPGKPVPVGVRESLI